MFKLFKKDEKSSLQKRYKKAMEEAMHIQRSGDLKLYAQKMEAAEALAQRIEAMK